MVDIHCHVLPGIDDGPKTMTDSLVMAQVAVKEGIHTIIATPHHQNGRYTQVTAASVTGKFSKTIQKLSHQLIETNLTHFIASDAHNTTSRGFALQEAYKKIRKRHGDEMFYMFMESAQLPIEGQDVYRNDPQDIKKKKKILGLF